MIAIKDIYGYYIIMINPKKIILGGDSSGSTFTLSLIYLIIVKDEFENEKIRMPDLILPFYPCFS